MSSQIFKYNIPKTLFVDFLNNICDIKEKYFLLNKAAYKKAEYHNYLKPFLNTLEEYYYNSKKFYVTRKMTYNYFLTVIRHLCKNTKIFYEQKILYTKSVYDITYHIYLDNIEDSTENNTQDNTQNNIQVN